MGWATRPLVTGPTGCSRYSNHETTPKFPPPPRSPQNRSRSSSALARTTSPAAVTTSAAIRLSAASPCLPMSQPSPPPSVRPAMPVVETTPPVVARPWSWVSRLNSPHVTPPWARTVRRPGIDVDALHEREVEHQPAFADGLPRDAVTAAADGKLQVVRARESNGVDDVGGPEAASDQGRTADEHAVVDATHLVVASVGGREDAAAQAGPKVLERCFLDHGSPRSVSRSTRGLRLPRRRRRPSTRRRPR